MSSLKKYWKTVVTYGAVEGGPSELMAALLARGVDLTEGYRVYPRVVVTHERVLRQTVLRTSATKVKLLNPFKILMCKWF